ncbi:MAG: helix-turn-helix transcriptional regulator [Nocardioidaceae bacterium]
MGSAVGARPTRIAARGGEQQQLQSAIEGAAEQRPCAWFVHGEPGVGKTRLVAETCAEAEDRGFTVLWGRCVHFGAASSPYAPIVAALEGWLAGAPEPQRSEVRADLDALGEVTDHPPGSDPKGVSGLVLRVVDRVLTRLTSVAPVMLVVDDLQWADVSSLDALAYVVAGFRQQRLVVAVTYRDTELGDGHPLHAWLADLRRLPSVHDLALKRLGRAGTREQLSILLGAVPDEYLVRQVYERSGGNPYLTELLVRDLRAGSTRLPPGLPDQLREVLLASWHQLLPSAREIVRLLAVVGRPSPYSLLVSLGDALGHDRSRVAAALVGAVRAGVLQTDGSDGYWFRHPLLAEVLYDSFLPGEAAPVHAALVELLEDWPYQDEAEEMRGLADLAIHHERCGRYDDAFRYTLRAAERAARLQGHPEQARHLLLAVDLLDQVSPAVVEAAGGEVSMLERAAYASSRSGDVETAYRLVSRAIGLVDRGATPLDAARLVTEWSELVYATGRVTKRPIARLIDAVEWTSADVGSPEHAIALSYLSQAQITTGLREDASRNAELAVESARRSGSAAAVAHALTARSSVHLHEPSAGADVDEAYRQAKLSGDPRLVGAVCSDRINYLLARGRMQRAVLVAAEGFAVCAATGTRGFQAYFAGLLSTLLLEQGDLAGSREWAREGLAARSTGFGGAFTRKAAAMLALRTGRLEEAAEHVRRLEELAPSYGSHVTLEGPVFLVEYLLATAGPAEALAVAERELPAQGVADERVGDMLLLWGARAAADLAQQARDAQDEGGARAAERRLEGLLAVRRQLPGEAFEPADEGDVVQPARAAVFAAEAARCRHAADAAERWEQAATACAVARARWHETVAKLRWAEALLTDGASRGRVGPVLRSAHDLARGTGATPLCEEAVALARSARISLERPTVPEPRSRNAARSAAGEDQDGGALVENLTEREREVLAHLAAGRSYREIAGALFISDKTVSVHVSNLLRKTGTHNRHEAAALARRHGIGP